MIHPTRRKAFPQTRYFAILLSLSGVLSGSLVAQKPTFPPSRNSDRVPAQELNLTGLWIETSITNFDGSKASPSQPILVHMLQDGNALTASEIRDADCAISGRIGRFIWSGIVQGNDSHIAMLWAQAPFPDGCHYLYRDSRLVITSPDEIRLFIPDPPPGDPNALAASWLVLHRLSSNRTLFGVSVPHFFTCPPVPLDKDNLTPLERAAYDEMKRRLGRVLQGITDEESRLPSNDPVEAVLHASWKEELRSYVADPLATCTHYEDQNSVQLAMAGQAITDAGTAITEVCPQCLSLTFEEAAAVIEQLIVRGALGTVAVADAPLVAVVAGGVIVVTLYSTGESPRLIIQKAEAELASLMGKAPVRRRIRFDTSKLITTEMTPQLRCPPGDEECEKRERLRRLFGKEGNKSLDKSSREDLRKRVAKALMSSDPDIALEGRVAYEFFDDVEEFDVTIKNEDGSKAGQIDVGLRDAIVEVKNGFNGKETQLNNFLNNPRLNPLGKRFFVYGPRLNPYWTKRYEDSGMKVFRDFSQLRSFLLHLK